MDAEQLVMVAVLKDSMKTSLLLLFTLALVCLQFSGSSAGNTGDPLPTSEAPPGFVAHNSSATKEKTPDKQKTENTNTDKNPKIEDTKADVTQSNVGIGKPRIPPGYRQVFDPDTGHPYLVADTELDYPRYRTRGGLAPQHQQPNYAVLDQLSKGFRQDGVVVVLNSNADKKDDKDKKKDESGPAIPSQVTALLGGGGLVTLMKCVQMLFERMGWLKKTPDPAGIVAAPAASTAGAATAAAAAVATPAPSKGVLVELAEIVSSPSSQAATK